MSKDVIFLLFVSLFFMGCSPVKFIYDAAAEKSKIPNDVREHFEVSENQTLLEFTSVFKDDNILIKQEGDSIFQGNINTGSLVGYAKLIPLNQENTIIYFKDRSFKIKLKGDKLKQYNYVYVSCYPKIDTADWITKEALKKSNYKVEFSNQLRIYD